MTRSTLLSSALVSACVFFVPLTGLQAQVVTIAMDVSCEDVDLRVLIRSYFSRELRELGGVRVAPTGTPDYRVEVIAVKERRGWVMSVVVSAPFDLEGFLSRRAQTADGDSLPELDPGLAALLGEYDERIKHSLNMGDDSRDLGEQISEIARSFDTEVLKERRKEQKQN